MKEGDTVKAGDPVLILEAMKMQNVVNAPISGVVKKLPFSVGASIAKGDVLCVIEAT